MSDYTPSTAEVRNNMALGVAVAQACVDDGHPELPADINWPRLSARPAAKRQFDRWITAHDRALREEVSLDLMEKLPRILAETSGDSFGWLSDGLYKDAEADSMDSEVYVRDGGIDLDQIAEYAARIVGGK